MLVRLRFELNGIVYDGTNYEMPICNLIILVQYLDLSERDFKPFSATIFYLFLSVIMTKKWDICNGIYGMPGEKLILLQKLSGL